MNTTEFLTEILPTTGFYCLARPAEYKGHSYHKHHVTTDLSDLVVTARAWDRDGFDVYYAMASLKEPKVFDPNKGDDGGYRVRTKPNIGLLRTVFLELDVIKPMDLEHATEEELARKYSDRNEALIATKDFCRVLGWPLPMVVDSGWGFHLYWPLEAEIEASKFEVLGKKLKSVAKHAKYKIDPACTDISRVFRVPGTHNYKNKIDPQQVKVLKPHKARVPYADLEAAVEAYIDTHNLSVRPAPERVHVPDYLNFGDTNTSEYANTPMVLERIVEKCGAIREFIDADADVSYHYWLHSLQVLRFCEGGRDLCHEVSARSDSYDQDTTDKVLNGFEEKDIPPTLCDTMAADSDACASCTYRGKVRSPAAFGRDSKPEQVAQVAMLAATGQMPAAPWPFKMEPGTGVMIEKRDKDDNAIWEVIYEYDLEPVKRVYSERDQREVTLWRTNNPADGFIEIEMPSASLYERRLFQSVLADNGVYCDMNKIDDLRRYMIAFIQEIQRVFQKEVMYSRMGWRDKTDRFIYAGKVYEPGSIRPCEVERQGRVVDAISQSGTLEEWREIMGYFEYEEFAGHQFGIGTAFGSVLMPFTGVAGGIISMVGVSGEGKSTVQKIVNSVWGHPTKLMLPAETKSSTYNAKISFINQMNNLPICAEEITNATADELGSLAYAITQGSEKWRADIKGTIRESQGGWCTTMLASGNSSMYEKLHSTQGSTAKALRIFEYRLNHVRVRSKADFRRGVDLALLDNYGTAGAVYIEYVTQNTDAVKERVKQKMLEIDDKYDMAAEERVWTAVIATNMVGLEIAKELGLHNFDLERVEYFILATLSRIRGTVTDMHVGPIDQLAAYIGEQVNSILVVEVDEDKKHALVLHKPTRELSGRYDVRSGELSISISALRKWCSTNELPFSQLMEGLVEQSLVIERSGRRTLGRHTDLPSTQTRVVTLDCRNPILSGAMRLVKNITAIGNVA